jgi:hypothetical protein
MRTQERNNTMKKQIGPGRRILTPVPAQATGNEPYREGEV